MTKEGKKRLKETWAKNRKGREDKWMDESVRKEKQKEHKDEIGKKIGLKEIKEK